MSFETPPIALTGDPLDRQDALRKKPGAVTKLLERSDALFLLLDGQELLLGNDGAILSCNSAFLSQLQNKDPGPLFLGTDPDNHAPWFAIDIARQDASIRDMLEKMGEFRALRAAFGTVPAPDLAMAGRAISLFAWHHTNQHCPRCGKASKIAGGGEKRKCAPCNREWFPRVDPAVIMLVIKQDQCLLGRNANWPKGVYSALAGFVEPGESFEEACRREVMEEAGISIGKVRYALSQPWPFPHSIMIGLYAEALDSQIVLDDDELEDAIWVSRPQAKAMLDGTHERLLPPFGEAASGRLLQAWVNETNSLF